MNDSDVRAVPVLLLQAGAALEEHLERGLEACGLSLAKLEVLRHLAAAGDAGVPLGHLAGRLCCAKSNVTQLVDRLQADGLVERRANPADRRRVVAVITPAGRERCERGLATRARAQEELLARLGAADWAVLAALLRRLLGERAAPAEDEAVRCLTA